MVFNVVKALLLVFLLSACYTQNNGQSVTNGAGGNKVFENVETGAKGSYASDTVRLGSGVWQLSDALIGRTGQDAKNGGAALRLKPGGSAETGFYIVPQKANAAIQYADYGKDAGAALTVYYRTSENSTWKPAGTEVRPATGLKRFTFTLPTQKAVQIRFENSGKGRLNLDDFEISGTVGAAVQTSPDVPAQLPGRDDNMALGNLSNAGKDKNNYLLQKPQYALSYNNSKGIANWVSWHLSAAWMGDADRCNCFAPDASLPAGFARVITSTYTGSGFDRGHLCPSADRSANAADNEATFLMTNITPQSPQLNQKPWKGLEDYCRRLAERGMEMYIMAGSYGSGGVGSNGDAKVIGGKVSVPARFWKIIVVLPQGENDLQRINKDTRVIAVDMPNVPEVSARNWNFYQTTVSTIEQATGYLFFSNLPASVQVALKGKQDGQR